MEDLGSVFTFHPSSVTSPLPPHPGFLQNSVFISLISYLHSLWGPGSQPVPQPVFPVLGLGWAAWVLRCSTRHIDLLCFRPWWNYFPSAPQTQGHLTSNYINPLCSQLVKMVSLGTCRQLWASLAWSEATVELLSAQRLLLRMLYGSLINLITCSFDQVISLRIPL